MFTVIIPPNGFSTFKDINKDKYLTELKLKIMIATSLLLQILLYLTLAFDTWSPLTYSNTLQSDFSIIDYCGIFICLAGIKLRRTAFKVLNEYFTYNVSISKDQKLIRLGPYEYIRHPSYTGFLFALVGYTMFIHGNIWCWIALSTSLIPLYFRITNEEEEMSRHFKDEYKRYKHETWSLIPYVY